MECWIVRILLVIYGMQIVKCCTLTSNGETLQVPDLGVITLSQFNDTMKAGDPIIEYVTDGVKGIEELNDETFIAAHFGDSKLTFSVKRDFKDFELNATMLQITTSLNVICEKDYPLNFQLRLKDTDNHQPTFNKPNYEFMVPMPWPAGISIPKAYNETIWVSDADTTSHLSIESINGDGFEITLSVIQGEYLPTGTYYKPYYLLDLRPKEALNEESLSLSITVKDDNSPTTSRVTTTIKVDRNPAISIPKSPTFEHQWYLIKMNDSINEGDKLIPENGPIKLENYDDISSVQFTSEGDTGLTSHFDFTKMDNKVEIKLNKKFSEPEPQFGFITLKVDVKNAAQPGYSVLNIIFSPPECPATTTAEPCTTPEITTTTSTTVTTVSSTTGISTTTDENISPTSTEDPCSRCPTITTECPSETTITEPTGTTTIDPVSKTTPEVKTTTKDPCSSCPTTITDCPDVTTAEATTCPVCNESTTSSTETIWSTDLTSRTTEATSCPECDCSTTIYSSEGSPATSSCQPCETCTTPEVTSCPTCDCSTTRDSSSTTSCPTKEPPAECNLYFPLSTYNQTLHVGDIGEICVVEAYSDPPLDPWNIHYLIMDGTNIVKDFSIIDGKLYSHFPLEAKNYTLTVTPVASCNQLLDVLATVHLSVYSIDICGNESDVEILFPEGVKFINVYEETHYEELSSALLIPPSLDCNFNLEVEPKMSEFKLFDNGKISMDPIDRENKIFQGVDIPEIKLNLTATCSLIKEFDWIERKAVMDSPSKRSVSMMILVYLLDKNDCKPEFASKNVTIGYPTKNIADEEMPAQLGIAEAYDADVGDNAKITYHVKGSYEVLIEEFSGNYYPHPTFFAYKDFEFIITARNELDYSECSVKVKILSQKYLTDLRVKGAQVADAQEIVKKLSSVTGLDIGFVTARLVESYGSKNFEETSFEIGIFGKPSYAFTDDIKEMVMDDLRSDDTFSLRLLVYAFKDGEALDTNTFQDKLNNIGGPMIAKAYVPVQYSVVKDQNAAVIALSVILALLILGVISFTVYRFWMKRRNCDNDSLERGLVSEKNDEIKDDSDFIYKSEKASISSGETGMADQTQDPDDLNPERRKSVAFAEEPQVIPGDDEDPQSNITGSVVDVKM